MLDAKCVLCVKNAIFDTYTMRHMSIHRYGNAGVKRCNRSTGMQPNAIEQLLNKINCSKFQNTDVQNFPLYFFKDFLCIMKGQKNWVRVNGMENQNIPHVQCMKWLYVFTTHL